MKYKTKGEAIKAYKEGKLAKWELEPILENIEFEQNLSELGKVILELAKEGKTINGGN